MKPALLARVFLLGLSVVVGACGSSSGQARDGAPERDGATGRDGGRDLDGAIGADGAGEPPPDAMCPPGTDCTPCSAGCEPTEFCSDGWCTPVGSGGLLDWAVPLSTTGNDFTYDLATWSDGGSIVVGSVYEGTGTIGITRIGPTTANDAIAVALDAAGAVTFARLVAAGPGGEVAQAVATRPDGGYVVAGFFEGTATFAPGFPGERTATAIGAQDAFLAAFAPDGSLTWLETFGGGGFDLVTRLDRLPDGSLFASGQIDGAVELGAGEPGATSNPGYGPTAFAARFTADGALVRVTFLGATEGSYAGGVSAHDDGSTAVAGTFFGTMVLSDTVTLTSYAAGDGFVAVYGPTGALAWARQLPGAGSDGLTRVAFRADGGLYVVGNFEGSTYLDTTPLASNGGWDFVVARYAADGALLWARTGGGVGEEEGPGVSVYPDGSVLVSTSFVPPSGSLITPYAMTIAAGTDREQVLTGSLLGGTFLARYQADGRLAWVRSSSGDGPGLASIQMTAADVDDGGHAVASGRFSQAITFGRGEPGETVLTHTEPGACCTNDVAVMRVGP